MLVRKFATKFDYKKNCIGKAFRSNKTIICTGKKKNGMIETIVSLF